MSDDSIEDSLKSVDPTRRAAIRSMVVKAAFVAPLVATFSMNGLSIHEAHAYGSNITLF